LIVFVIIELVRRNNPYNIVLAGVFNEFRLVVNYLVSKSVLDEFSSGGGLKLSDFVKLLEVGDENFEFAEGLFLVTFEVSAVVVDDFGGFLWWWRGSLWWGGDGFLAAGKREDQKS
jgi:hypothetical protein